MKKIGMIFAIGVVLSGCTTVRNQAIDTKASASLKGQTVTYTVHKKPDFAAMTPAKAAFALLGALAMISEGNTIIASNDVDDPARLIGLGLTKSLSAANTAQMITPPASVDGTEVAQIVAAVKNARFIVDVQTINWSLAYFPTNWTHYRLIYSAKARLIDAQSKETIAEGFCSRVPDETSTAPTYDELVLNAAAGLKRELVVAANECLTKFRTEMLKLPATPGNAQQVVYAPAAPVVPASNAQVSTHAVSAAPPVQSAQTKPAALTVNPVAATVQAVPAPAPAMNAATMPAAPAALREVEQDSGNTTIQTVEFQVGVSSVTVEKMAKEAGCQGGKGASLLTTQGPVEVYRMRCDSGKTYMAKCELRQCSAMR